MTPHNKQEKINLLRANGLYEEARELEKVIFAQEFDKRKRLAPAIKRTTQQWLDKFHTQDEKMQGVKETILKLAPYNDPVLITGPTGTGKELLAQALHAERPGMFVDINCAGLPVNLIEHELFGSVKGAFTGADKEKVGLMSAANNGTLFLDEIGELPMETQGKLLRAIETMTIRKVGANSNEQISCRFIAATKQPLHEWVKLKKFREDLFYRLNTFVVQVTALKQRPDDISHIAKKLNGDQSFFSEEQMKEIFANFNSNMDPFPGNVRSIKAMIRRKKILGRMIFD